MASVAEVKRNCYALKLEDPHSRVVGFNGFGECHLVRIKKSVGV